MIRWFKISSYGLALLILVLFIFPPISSASNLAAGITPTLHGVWNQTPTSLNLIVDGDTATGSGNGRTNYTSVNTTYIQIDLGSINYINDIYYNTILITDENAAACSYLETQASRDNVTFITYKLDSICGDFDSQTFYGNLTVDNEVRYIRQSVYTNGQFGGTTLGGDVGFYELQAYGISLVSPLNGSTIYYSYPPMTTNVNFVWTGQTGNVSYNLLIAKDINFNIISVNATIANNYSVRSLDAGNYWWRVRHYNITSRAYGNYSDTSNFTLTSNVSTTGTGIHGVVYKLVNGVPTPISGANVYIYNNQSTYTNMVTTGSNGYYLFTGLTNSTTYVIRATKTDEYDDSAVYYVTTGLGTTPIQNILMQTCTVNYNCYVNIIKMRFGLRYLNGSEIPDVLATVYKSGELIATDAGTTGSDGNVVFGLLRTQKYHVVFTLNSVQIGTWDGYPSDAINIEISSGVTITPITPDTNATYINASQHGTYAWGLDYFTGTNLTSSIGLGIKGQGLVTSIILLFLISFGGTAAGIVIAFMLSVLGIMSYKFVIILAIFSAAWYVIKREFT